jgi:hypothetical protein
MAKEISATDALDTNIYQTIRETLVKSRAKAYADINFAIMVEAYWNIGRQIMETVADRAEYGKRLMEFLAGNLTEEFGKGFTVRNLQTMRQFYLAFPIPYALCAELSWSHYRLLIRIEDAARREFYAKECAESNWSVRQLERQINSVFLPTYRGRIEAGNET